MAGEDWIVDELILTLVDEPATANLHRHLAEMLLADHRPDEARMIATAAMRTCPGDLALLRVVVDAGVVLPESVGDLAARWTSVPAPVEP